MLFIRNEKNVFYVTAFPPVNLCSTSPKNEELMMSNGQDFAGWNCRETEILIVLSLFGSVTKISVIP